MSGGSTADTSDILALILLKTGCAWSNPAGFELIVGEEGREVEASPQRAARMALLALIDDGAGPPPDVFDRAACCRLDEVTRIGLVNENGLAGRLPRKLEILLKPSATIIDILEAIVRLAIDEPLDFDDGGAFEHLSVTCQPQTFDASLNLLIFGELRELVFGEVGGHRRAMPHYRRSVTIDAPVFADLGRLFHRERRA